MTKKTLLMILFISAAYGLNSAPDVIRPISTICGKGSAEVKLVNINNTTDYTAEVVAEYTDVSTRRFGNRYSFENDETCDPANTRREHCIKDSKYTQTFSLKPGQTAQIPAKCSKRVGATQEFRVPFLVNLKANANNKEAVVEPAWNTHAPDAVDSLKEFIDRRFSAASGYKASMPTYYTSYDIYKDKEGELHIQSQNAQKE